MFSSGSSRNWRGSLQQAKAAMLQKRLDKAVQIVRRDRLHEFKPGQKLIARLVRDLAQRASTATVAGELVAAWNDLSAADAISLPDDRDRISRQMNGLVDLTIQQSEAALKSGRAEKALNILNELWRRRIADRRADEIHKVAKIIVTAENLASTGDFPRATKQLQLARSLRPDLGFLKFRLEDYQNNRLYTRKLTRELRHKLLDSSWNEAKQISSRLLKIAPAYKVALDALKRCLGKSEKQESVVVIADSQSGKSGQSTVKAVNNSESVKVKKGVGKLIGIGGRDANENTDGSKGNHSGMIESSAPQARKVAAFLLWIDGTGGFLVCDGPSVVVGQAVEQARVEIPILGDLNRRHMRFHQTEQGHLLEPWGNVGINQKVIKETTPLGQNATVQLGSGIVMQYRRKHPLSQTARVELTSRHRTQPWSDSIILMSDMIVIGPGKQAHIRCPELSDEIIIYKMKDQLMCRFGGLEYEIDGRICKGKQPIHLESRIVGDDFSIMLEPISA